MGNSLKTLEKAMEEDIGDENCRKAFDKYDKDESGKLDKTELSKFVKDLYKLYETQHKEQIDAGGSSPVTPVPLGKLYNPERAIDIFFPHLKTGDQTGTVTYEQFKTFLKEHQTTDLVANDLKITKLNEKGF